MVDGEADVRANAPSSHRQLLADRRFVSIIFVCLAASMGTNVVAAALPSITAAFGVSDSTAGLLITAYTLPAMVAVPVSGVLADVYGRRSVLVPSLVVYGVAGAAIAFVGSFPLVLALRGVQGVAIAGIAPVAITVIGDLYTGASGSTAQGLRVSAMGVGGTVLPVLVGYLSSIAWNIPFALYGFGLLVGVVVYVVLPETAVDRAHDAGLRASLAAYWRSLRSEITRTDTFSLITGGFARDFVRYGLITFLPLFAVRTLGASYVAAGAILGIRGVAYLVISPLAGLLADTRSRRFVLVWSVALCAVSVALVPFSPSTTWLMVVVGAYAVGDAAFSPVLKDIVTSSTTTRHRSGVVSGMNTMKYAGQTLGPVFFGLLLAVAGFTELFVVASLTIGAYGLALAFVLGDV